MKAWWDQGILDQMHRSYQAEGNALYAWEALRFARSNKVDVPEWVLAYFDGCASALLNNDEPTKALALAVKGGPGKQKQHADRRRDVGICARIDWLWAEAQHLQGTIDRFRKRIDEQPTVATKMGKLEAFQQEVAADQEVHAEALKALRLVYGQNFTPAGALPEDQILRDTLQIIRRVVEGEQPSFEESRRTYYWRQPAPRRSTLQSIFRIVAKENGLTLSAVKAIYPAS